MAETVCAVVVTYNRKNLLLECLEALRKQTRPVDAIYLVDNASTDGTPEMLLKQGYVKEPPPDELFEPWESEHEIPDFQNGKPIRIHYVRMHENAGGAGGFYEGIKRAYEKGYDWFWLMDDDAEPEEKALEELEKFFDRKNCVALASLVIGRDGKVLTNHRGYFSFQNLHTNFVVPIKFDDVSLRNGDFWEIEFASFVGILVKRSVVERIGFPDKRFFIHHDDVEYCVRLKCVGKMFLVVKSIILHKEGAKIGGIRKQFLTKHSLRTPYDSLWLRYYGMRNLVFLGRKYSTNKKWFYRKLIAQFLRFCVGIVLFDDRKLKRLIFTMNAFWDGLRGCFDNQKPKRILYNQK